MGQVKMYTFIFYISYTSQQISRNVSFSYQAVPLNEMTSLTLLLSFMVQTLMTLVKYYHFSDV